MPPASLNILNQALPGPPITARRPSLGTAEPDGRLQVGRGLSFPPHSSSIWW